MSYQITNVGGTVTGRDVRYHVGIGNGGGLPPIVLSVHAIGKPFSFQDYLTVDEARALVAVLLAAVGEVREAQEAA
jgi:hypothetical protein